jgi:hypothetical protein
MPQADISEPVLPANLHCEFDLTDVNGGIREDTCPVIERRKAHGPVLAEELLFRRSAS